MTALKDNNSSLIHSLHATWCNTSSSKRFLAFHDSENKIALDQAINMIKKEKDGLQRSVEIMSILGN